MFDFISFIPRAIMQGIPLLFGSTGETLTEKSGNLNLGIPGVMYVGGILFGIWGMMVFNIISNCLGCSILILVARYHWKRFDVMCVESNRTERSKA